MDPVLNRVTAPRQDAASPSSSTTVPSSSTGRRRLPFVALIAAAVLALLPEIDAHALERDAAGRIVAVGRHMLPRIVRVHARTADGRSNVGSGVPIAADLVVTNCHVTRRAHYVDVVANTIDGPGIFRAKAQSSSVSQDVCILRLAQRLSLPPVRMGETPAVGEPVVAVGFTGGVAPHLHIGEVLKTHAHDGGQVLETSTAFDQGASGGGVFGKDGEFVGLITFRSQERQPRYFVTPVQWIASLLENQPFEPVAPLSGTPFWQQTGALLPEFLRGHLSPRPDPIVVPPPWPVSTARN